jgi:nucleotide-binding universal stress UspA family protein
MASGIVVGVDHSQPSRAALEWSAGRARDGDTALSIVHVTPGGPDAGADAAGLLSRERARAEELGATVDTELVEGDPFGALVDASRSAALVVVGTHKTGFIQGHVLGSRFIGLAATALSPVAFIPSIPLVSRSGVVVLVDGSPAGRRAVSLAAAQAELLGEYLTLVYAAAASDELERATERVRSETPGVTTRSRLARRGLASELIAATLLASVVVVPDSGGAVGSAGANLMHDVILNLGGPTIVVPGHP